METENLNPAEQSEELQDLREPAEEVTETPSETEEIKQEAAKEESNTEETPQEPSEEVLPEETPKEESSEQPEPPIEEAEEGTEEAAAELRAAKNKRRRTHRSALRFWGGLFGLVLCILILLICIMTPFRSWLEQYEASQPEHARSEVYQLLFADPDWELLYDLAGVECTIFEGKEAFAAYMDEKVGGRELVCLETSAGLSGNRKYMLTCGGDEIATFTLAPDDAQFTSWSLSGVEVFYTPDTSVTVVKAPTHTVYINGIPLDDSYTTLSVETVAENYLPDDVHGYRLEQQQIHGLLSIPEVVVLDEYNNPLSVFYSAETGIYSVTIPTTPEINDEKYSLIVDAAKAHALFSIRAINTSELRQHFDPNSDAYAEICDTVALRESYKSYSFNEDSISVTDFYQYSDDIFSVRISLTLDVMVKKKEEVTYPLEFAYIFTKNNSGTYLVTAMPEEDLRQEISMYHLTYMCDDTVLQTLRVPVDSVAISAPTTVAEGGATVIAWGKLRSDGTLTPVLELQDDGTYFLALGQSLEAMTLYPIFDTESVVE